ncbi:uncharacterized protein LOC113339504 [Papaver somniferum]|uniref:uncharacterized protein LOC113339504 n=1 Tax=Papaver somniferum TaxID=3469 RepID=UPI000E6FEF19|nr:uncharacterized protein LOC113339504 [Papaver somniferum]
MKFTLNEDNATSDIMDMECTKRYKDLNDTTQEQMDNHHTFMANGILYCSAAGELNLVLHDTEKFSTHPIDANETSIFNEKILNLDLIDLGFTGCPFTWSNKIKGYALTEQRLDRGLANDVWMVLYPNTTITNLLAIGSDHHPILLNSNPHWKNARKLKDIKLQLRVWNKEVYGNIKTNIDECKQHLTWLHTYYFREDRGHALAGAREELKKWQDIEEKFWKTKYRDQLIKLGDQNTSYFHEATKSITRRNKIDTIQDEEGNCFTDYQDIKNCFTNHFSKMATAETINTSSEIIHLIPQTISPYDNLLLNRKPEPAEIKAILFNMAND